jgi:PAS domain S-box-containing protein
MKQKKEKSQAVDLHLTVSGESFKKENILLGVKNTYLPENGQAGAITDDRGNSYSELFNSVTEAIYIQKEDGTFLDVNNGATKMYGYSRQELVGRNPEFVSAPGMNDLAAIINLTKRVALTGRSEQFEFWGRRKNGEIFPKEVVCNKGKYMGEDVIFTTARDITERKLSDIAIKDSEEKYRMLLELAPDAFFQGDAMGNFITVNSKAITLTGFSRDELLKMNMKDLFSEEILIKNQLRYDLLQQGETVKSERKINKKDGSFISVEMNSKLMPDGSYQSFFRDITERKKAEEDLQKERKLLKTFVDNIPISIFIKDRESRKVLSNPADRSNIQKTEQEVIGKNDYDLFSPKEAEGFIKDDRYVMDNDISIEGKEETILNKQDGSIRLMSTTKMPFKNDLGETIGVIGFSFDITERKRVEEALRESEKRFRSLFEHSPDAIILADIETGIIIDANSEASRLLARPAEEIRGMHQAELHPHRTNAYSKKSFRSQIRKLIEKNEYQTIENLISRKDGSEVPVEVLASIITIDGRPVLQGVFRDIAERKRAEEALQQSKERLNRGELVSKTGNWELHLDSGKMLASEGAKKIYGVNSEIGNLPDLQKIPLPEYRSLLDNALKYLIEKGEPYNVEFKIKKVDTGEITDVHSLAEYDKEKNIVFGVIQDITERKRAEKIQKVLYNISGAVSTTNNIEGLFSFIQDQLGTLVDATNFYIASYNEATDMITSTYCRDENDEIESWPASSSLTGIVIKENKPLLVTKDDLFKKEWLQKYYQIGTNSEVWLGVPLREEGKVTGAFVVQSYNNPNAYNAKDVEMLEFISDQISISIQRKKAEQAIKAAKEKAEESDRLKTAFLANMSHEIRTPMNGILGFAELLDDNSLTQERRREFISVISSSSKQLLTVINDIIDISKIESGQLIISNVRFNLNELMHKVLMTFDNIKINAGKPQLKLLLEEGLSDHESNVICDDVRLSQVLYNLLGNALKFTSVGFVKLGYRLEQGNLVFYVQDSGKGIPNDKQHFIFDRFRQVEESNTRQFGGTGLGLSISRGLVELMGGSLWVKSEENTGSTFYFTIPGTILTVAQIPVVEKHAPNHLQGFNGSTILVAEDILSNFNMIQIMLQKSDARLLYAEDGAQAVKICREHAHIDLVLMDIQMPEMNGYEATREIRKFLPNLPIIALTAYAFEEDKLRVLNAGCNDLLAKPIDKEGLISKLSKFLHKDKNAWD